MGVLSRKYPEKQKNTIDYRTYGTKMAQFLSSDGLAEPILKYPDTRKSPEP